jgi:hypothetical protein
MSDDPKHDPDASSSSYQLILVEGYSEIYTFTSLDGLKDKLYELMQSESTHPERSRVFIFDGKRMYLTKGKNKRLALPDGKLIPIEPITPPSDDLDIDGYLVEPDDINGEDIDELDKDLTEDEASQLSMYDDEDSDDWK